MKHFPLIGALALLSTVSMTSCVDDKYDLSDIDATTEIKIKDLVIPINLDAVTLGDIIDLNEGSELTDITINGQTFYALRKDGNFHSDKISIPEFSIPAPQIPGQTFEVDVPTDKLSVIPGFDISSLEGQEIPEGLSIPVNEIEADLKFESGAIDDAIESINDIYTSSFTIAVNFTCTNFTAQDSPTVPKLVVNLPKGLLINEATPAGSQYDSSTGVLTVKNLGFDNSGVAQISLTAGGINNLENNGYYNKNDKSNPVSINDKILINPFTIEINRVPKLTNNQITLSTAYDIDGFSVKEVTGKIQYSIDVQDIPVDITGLPDFLSGDDTNLILANPQIYLSLNNPLDQYKLKYTSGLSITPLRHNGEVVNPLMPETPIVVEPGTEANAIYNFCLSPTENDLYLKDVYSENFQHINFQALCNVIAGKGIPNSLKISLVNPCVPSQKVERFKLGTDLNPVDGKWEILAPLALKNDPNNPSQIIYSDKKTGWYDDDMKDLEIEELTLSMIADSELSLTAILSGSPIDKEGNKMSHVTVEEVKLLGNTSDQNVVISVKADEGYCIKNLDGFEFTAKVTSGSETPLSPNQKLILKNIRAKVSGKYTTNFE